MMIGRRGMILLVTLAIAIAGAVSVVAWGDPASVQRPKKLRVEWFPQLRAFAALPHAQQAERLAAEFFGRPLV